MTRKPPWLRPPRRRAQILLPALTGEEAIKLVALLERAIAAICRAHGDDMADHQAMLGIDTPPPRDAVQVGNPDAPDDIDF